MPAALKEHHPLAVQVAEHIAYLTYIFLVFTS